MRVLRSAGLACFIIASSVVAAPFAQSANPQYATISGSGCKLAGINNNPNYVSKATGGRNESTSAGVFVICPFNLAPVPADGGAVLSMNVTLYSLDGKSHNATCTTVIGSLNRFVPPTYSAKSVTVPVEPTGTVATWTAADFGGTTGAPISGSAWTTVTCLLPPQTGIGLLYALYNPNLGNEPPPPQ